MVSPSLVFVCFLHHGYFQGCPKGFPFGYQSGWWNGGVPPPYINNVLSPRLLLSGGAVQKDLSAEAPHNSDIFCSYSAGVRCLATAAVLVTFAAKSDIRKDKKTLVLLAYKSTQINLRRLCLPSLSYLQAHSAERLLWKGL